MTYHGLDANKIKEIVKHRTSDESAGSALEAAMKQGIETAWDRLEKQQPQCGFGEMGICCNRCTMGPCRIDPFNNGPDRGVCGADNDLIAARNFLDDLATGAAAHSDHGREVVETLFAAASGKAKGYKITDTDKLNRIAEELGVETENRETNDIAKEVALALLEEFGTINNRIQFVERACEKTRTIWNKAGIYPRSVDREIVECMHRIHMGVGADYANILLHGLRTSLSDGWGGSMMATEISDVLFGTPQIASSTTNMGVLKADRVNIVLHGHNPILSEMVVKAAEDPKTIKMAETKGAKGINLVGMCCTGNELLMRKGIPVAGNMLNQELLLATGAVEVMVVDYQCIFPSIAQTAACFHSKIVSTSEKSKVPGAVHMEFHPHTASDTAAVIVKLAVENFSARNPDRVNIPAKPVDIMAGFSVEAIVNALGGSLQPLVDVIAAGKIRGAVGIVGCNNPKIKHDYGHVTLAKELIKRDILVVETGCAAIASGKAGLLMPGAGALAGSGLSQLCKDLGIPPVLHMGSCVDCSRILVLGAELGKALDVGIDQLPLAGAAPEWYSQKAVSIASYFVSSGVYTVLGIPPKIFGSSNVIKLVTKDLEDIVHASFAVEPDPVAAAQLISDHIEKKRKHLGI
ncbi:MAG: anaerobic carbon-monoxide dehydrogenase catalytic subunit [Thermodesulfobacteriota bacterium]|nr:anaerobic carbon-monoxide dehydrogenase catalytic subunit [Thermodesulfobacteriota bacterium]